MRKIASVFILALALAGLLSCAGPAKRLAARTCFQIRAALQWKQACAKPGPDLPSVWLTVPAGDISLPVLDGTTGERLSRAPCSESIGRSTLILAHRDIHFRGLRNVQPGDTVELEQRDGSRQTFRITERMIVESSNAEKVLAELGREDRLILATCYPFYFIGPAPSRILFIAEPETATNHMAASSAARASGEPETM